MQDIQQDICAAIKEASQEKQSLQIVGGNSKSFYANPIEADHILNISSYQGIIDYEPSELFITARAGTPLKEIESELDKHQQMLPFEPPHYGENATIGGTIACGFSGPRRPYAGAARDCILGADIINGQGEYLKFGGQVMKNVAGYDVSRAMCGSLGTLGVIMQISLKVLPKPKNEISVKVSSNDTLKLLNKSFHSNLPLSASYAENNISYLRVDAPLETIKTSLKDYDVEEIENGSQFWLSVKEQQRDFFTSDASMWRLSVPINTPTTAFEEEVAIEWNGGLRWLKTDMSATNIHQVVKQYNGHATLFRTSDNSTQRFTDLTPELKQLHLNLKHAFDPNRVLNPGRMYSWC